MVGAKAVDAPGRRMARRASGTRPVATSVVLRRGIPTTLNTPALPIPEPFNPFDNVFMLDGRQRTLELQAAGAIHDHAVATVAPSSKDLERIKEFQLTDDSSRRAS